MRILKGSIALLLVLSAAPSFASWQINTVATETDYTYDLVVGSGRGDGNDRLYAANRNGYMYEYTYNTGAWNRVAFGHNFGTEWAYHGVAVGQPTNFTSNIIVAGNENNSPFWFRWNGTEFNETSLGAQSAQIWKTAIGRGRNTATTYVYYACANNNVYEQYFNGSAFNMPVTVGSTGSQAARAVAVGLGRSTDTNYYVYGGGTDGRLYEFRWNGASYERTQITNTGGQINDIVIEAGRNGSSTRYVYCGNNNGQVWESVYNGTSWASTSITASSIGVVNAIAIGDGRDDGTIRLYAATNNDRIYEFTWNNVCWSTPLDCGSPSANNIYSLAFGYGRNTGTPYLYAGSADFTVYEYEWIPPTATTTPTISATATLSATATPSPTASLTATATPTATASLTASLTRTATATPTRTLTASLTPTATVTPTRTASPTATATRTASLTATASLTRTVTSTASITPSISPTPTISATFTISPTASITPTFTTTPTPAPAAPGTVTAYPVPGQDQINFAVELGEAGEVSVMIYNLNAELVAQVKEPLPAGRGVLVWDCRAAAAGVYLARVKAPGAETKTVRIAVAR